MQLFVFPYAPNPLKPIILIGEKSIDVEVSYIDKSNYNTFLQLSPSHRTPILVVENNRVISESLTICQYLDEISGSPRLFGDTFDERIEISMWERRAEIEFFNECARVYHNIHPMFRRNVAQSSERASEAFGKAANFLRILDERLKKQKYLAGDSLSAADITAYIGFFWLTAMGVLDLGELGDGSRRWNDDLAARPGCQPLLQIAPILKVQDLQRTET